MVFGPQNLIGTNAPEFPPDRVWLNGGPISLKQSKDKIFLIEFWTYSCVNCLRVLPHLKRWHEKYKDLGLVVIGVHTPEFEFEKDVENIKQAAKNLGVTFPIVIDSDYKIWNLYSNHWWPRKLLINSKGKIVYDHIGEGGYEETEAKIYELLRQDIKWPKEKVPLPEATEVGGGGICYQTTPETYLGYERGRIGEGKLVADDPADYRAPLETSTHQWYLSGRWIARPEYVEHAVETRMYTDYLLIHYQSVAVHCVITTVHPADLMIHLNGMPLTQSNAGGDVTIQPDGKSILRVTEPKMYNIVKDTVLHEGTLKILVKDAGVKLHVFTFGGCPGQI